MTAFTFDPKSPRRRWAAMVSILMVSGMGLAPPLPAGETLRITGSTTVNVVIAEAAEVLRAETGMTILVDTAGGSTGGVTSAADGRADLGMSSRPLDARDRARHPGAGLRMIAIGADAIAPVVSKDVWDGGVRSLSKEDLRRIYEREVTNWNQLGGPDLRLVFFNKEPGRGTWEVFAQWLYGDADKAPPVAHPEVGANEEVRSKVGATRGALSFVSAGWADGERVFALSLRQDDGTVIAPDAAAVADGSYELGRPLYLISRGEPGPAARVMIDFMLGDRGSELLARHGYVPARAGRQVIEAE